MLYAIQIGTLVISVLAITLSMMVAFKVFDRAERINAKEVGVYRDWSIERCSEDGKAVRVFNKKCKLTKMIEEEESR